MTHADLIARARSQERFASLYGELADALEAQQTELGRALELLRGCVVAFSEIEPKPEDYAAVNEAAIFLDQHKEP